MNDLISRQAAIDAIKEYIVDPNKPISEYEDDIFNYNAGLKSAVQAIVDLPSAQRKVLKYTGESICVNCWTHNCDGCMYEPTEGVQ